MTKIQSVTFSGPAGRLEGLLRFEESTNLRALAVICHPHPLYQGTMHNKVTFAIAEAFFQLGCKVLRFNFRGVGLSTGIHDQGRGEVEDALAAVQFLRQQHPDLACHVGGFSFGGMIAIRAAERETSLASLTAVAPFKSADGEGLDRLALPKLFLQGTADEICPLGYLQQIYPGFAEPKKLKLFEGAGHFFENRLDDLKSVIVSESLFLGI